MPKNYTITVVLETPNGREYLKDFEYRHVYRHNAITDVNAKLQYYRECGYVTAYIGNVAEWYDVWF